MAPAGSGKRKRGDRTYSHDGREETPRPSPHRPGSLALGQQSLSQQGQIQSNFNRDQYDQRGGGRRRGSRGGRGGGPQRSPVNSPNGIPVQSRPGNGPSPAKITSPPPILSAQSPLELLQTNISHPNSNLNAIATQTAESRVAPPMLYCYEHITIERLNSWSHLGRGVVIDDGIQACKAEDALTLSVIFQELVRSSLDGRLDGYEAGSIIREILEQGTTIDESSNTGAGHSPFDASSLFLDSVSIITENTNPSLHLQPLIQATGITPLLMRCILDSTLLENLGMIRNTFVRVGIRQQTNLIYRQSNYNLLREETEGYSKLVTELFTTSSSEPLTSEVVEETFERVKGMIGAFDLDVGRVLDVTLDVFAAVLVKQYRFFVKYLRASSWWPQQKAFDGTGIDLSLGTLPKWALPGSSGRPVGDDEKGELAKARDERDKIFWKRVREIGMGAYFEIGGRRAEKEALEEAMQNGNISNISKLEEDREWIDATGTLPPSGNKVAAQVLGFKLRFYSSPARDPTDILPLNLIYLAALLIKIGFISLRDLYPHLWPADEAMDGVRVEKMKEKAEKEKLNRPGGGTMNALMTAGALVDDTQPVNTRIREAERLRELDSGRKEHTKAETAERNTPAPQLEEKEELPTPADQKVQLLKSLLCIGAIPESLYMLGRFPWLPEAFPELPEHIHRILHHSLNKVYEPLRPLKDRANLRDQQKILDPDQSSVAKGQLRLMEASPRKTLRWAQLDKEDMNEATDYRFYWDDWADNVPVCQSIDDVFLLCSTLLNYVGVKIGHDTTLLLKLARIGSHSLTTDPSAANTQRWIDLSKRLLVPALSLTKCNPGVVNEVFDMIKSFPTTTRYSIYAEWYTGQTSRLPDIQAAFAQAKAETKDVLKRISKTNVKPMARALAKVAYASPGVVFEVAIAQIEVYDNLVDTVVECARYFTYLGYDVLSWSLMNSLGSGGRARTQDDGMVVSKWLASLSLFSGKVFKRYSVMSPTPILQYVAEQLHRGNTVDLVILSEITGSMAGIVSDTLFNESQVLSMAGGKVLQAQIMLQIHDKRHESRTTAKRLIKSLTDPGLAGHLLVSIAQERQTCIFKAAEADSQLKRKRSTDSDSQLKQLGNLFDEVHRILVQYLDLLRSNLSIEEFDHHVPNITQLINEYGIEPNVAFWIGRPNLTAAMAEHDAKTFKSASQVKKSPTKELNGDSAETGGEVLNATILEETNNINSTPQVNAPAASPSRNADENLDSEMSDVDITSVAATAPLEAMNDSVNQPWHPVLQRVIDTISLRLPPETENVLSLPFYVTFWQLSLHDMLVPTGNYEDEINRQKRRVLTISSDRTDISILGTQKKDREKKAIGELQDRLRAELRDHVAAYGQTRVRLQREKEHWFSDLWGKWDAMNVALLEHCFFPRILISPVDAMYAFKMLKYLHSSGAPNFRTIGFFDQLFREKKLISMIFICTAKEAENFGRFLTEVLKDLSRWHADKAVFEKEAYGRERDLPGFSKNLKNDKSPLTFYDYEDFRRILLKWHRYLHSALKFCIANREFMHVRNAVNILTATCQYFPAVNWMGYSLVKDLKDLSNKETRGDLQTAMKSVAGNLGRREKDWVLPQAFSLSESSTNVTDGARATSAKPATPQANDMLKTLNPKAADFSPSSRTSLNGVSQLTKTNAGKLEVEDGEIEDARQLGLAETAIPPTGQPMQGVVATSSNETKVATDSLPPAPSSKATNVLREDSIPNSSNRTPLLPENHPPVQPAHPTGHEIPPKLPSSTATNYPSVTARSEPARAVSANVPNGRLQHTLPTRPELPPPVAEHRVSERPGERGSYPRDSRFPERGRADRSGGSLRERIPDHNGPESYPRRYEQSNEKPHMAERNRAEQGWGDEKPLPGRTALDDRHNGPRRSSGPPSRDERMQRDRVSIEPSQHLPRADFPGQAMRESAMAPPRLNTSQHPDNRAAVLVQGAQDQQQSVSNQHPDRRSEPSRYEGFPNSERNSRASSPLRNDDRSRSLRREDRPPIDRRISDEGTHSHPSRYGESHLPTGPRGISGAPGSTDRFREAMKVDSVVTQSVDASVGRLSQDSGHHGRPQESQYGRLNPATEIPSGPRLPNGNHPLPTTRGARNIGVAQPQINAQQQQNSSHNVPPASPILEKQAPTGPSARGAPRNSAPFSRPESTSSAAPAAGTENKDTAGVHPDRLKAIQGHTPPNSQTPINTTRPGNSPLSAVLTPTPIGPRGPGAQLPSPVAPSPTTRGPPTGPSNPSNSSERNRGDRVERVDRVDRADRGDKRFAGIHNVLAQSNAPNGPERSGQGASIRGRGGRANHASIVPPSTLASNPPTASVARPEPYPPRTDLFAGRTSAPTTPQRADEDPAHGRSRRGGREVPRDGERRSERHRGNRSRSRENAPAPPMPPREEERTGRREDMRDRVPRGAPPPPLDRDMRRTGPRDGPRDVPRESLRDGPRDGAREDQSRGRRADPDRREMDDWNGPRRGEEIDRRDERERRDGGGGGGGSGRKRGRAGDDVQGDRGRADNKRSRRIN